MSVSVKTANDIDSKRFDLIHLSQKKKSISKPNPSNQQQFMQTISLTRGNISKKQRQLQKQQQYVYSEQISETQSPTFNIPQTQITNSQAASKQKKKRKQIKKNNLLLTVEQEMQSDATSSVSQAKQSIRFNDTFEHQQKRSEENSKQRKKISQRIQGQFNNQQKSAQYQKIQERIRDEELFNFQQKQVKKQVLNIRQNQLKLRLKKQTLQINLLKQKKQYQNQQLAKGKQCTMQIQTNQQQIECLSSKNQRNSINHLQRRTDSKSQQGNKYLCRISEPNKFLKQQKQMLTDQEVQSHPLFKKLLENKNQIKIKYENLRKKLQTQTFILKKELQLKNQQIVQQIAIQKKQKQSLQKKIQQYAQQNQRLHKQVEKLTKDVEHYMFLSQQLANISIKSDQDSQQKELFSQLKRFRDQNVGTQLQTQYFKLKRKLVVCKKQLDDVRTINKQTKLKVYEARQERQKLSTQNKFLKQQIKQKQSQLNILQKQIKENKQNAGIQKLKFQQQVQYKHSGRHKKAQESSVQRLKITNKRRPASELFDDQNNRRKLGKQIYKSAIQSISNSKNHKNELQAKNNNAMKKYTIANQYFQEYTQIDKQQTSRVKRPNRKEKKFNRNESLSKYDSSPFKGNFQQDKKKVERIKQRQKTLFIDASKQRLFANQNNIKNSIQDRSFSAQQLTIRRIKSYGPIDIGKSVKKTGRKRLRSPQYQSFIANQKKEKQQHRYKNQKHQEYYSIQQKAPSNVFEKKPVNHTKGSELSLNEKLQKLKRQMTEQIENVKNQGRKQQNSYDYK